MATSTFNPVAEVTAEQSLVLDAANFHSMSFNDQLRFIRRLVDRQVLPSYELFLPFCLRLKGDPYSLKDHFAFSTLYRTDVPRTITVMSGRQVAKCCPVYADDAVILENGRRVSGALLNVGDRVVAFDGLRHTTSRVIAKIRIPERPVYKIETRSGCVVGAAGTHPFRSLYGWTPVTNLKVGDRVAAMRCGGEFGTLPLTDRATLTAYMIGDGACGTSGNWHFTKAPGPAVVEFTQLANKYETAGVVVTERAGTPALTVRLHTDNAIVKWLTADGLAGKKSPQKFIPAWVFDLTREATIVFLSRLWATDGQVTTTQNGTPSICYSSASPQLARDVQSLLAKFGIPTSYSVYPAGYRDDAGEYVECHDEHSVRVETREGWRRFMATFDVPGKPPVPIPETMENNNRDTVPIEVREIIADIGSTLRKKKPPMSLASAGLRLKPKHALTYEKARAYLAHFEAYCPDHPRLAEFREICSGEDVYWDEIVSITPLPLSECWDIEVEQTNNYVLGGLLSHNSTNIASLGVLTANIIPNHRILFVTPLYEQIRRFSSNYVRPFINSSPFKAMWTSTKTENSVLQKTFTNGSMMQFTFALLDADRARGISAGELDIDELQDIDPANIPILEEVLSASNYKLKKRTGTPKSFDNPMATEFANGSQAHWKIKCKHCGKYNIADPEEHLFRMIGPAHADICMESPGIICAYPKCRKPLDPRPPWGRWYHKYPERRLLHSSYQVPQIIFPMHYGRHYEWSEVHRKMNTYGQARFFNEVLGIPCDFGQRLVTENELIQASDLPWDNVPDSPHPDVTAWAKGYRMRALAVDWGGGGEKAISYTALALLGMRDNGRVDVLWGKRLTLSANHFQEAAEVLHWYKTFGCDVVVHDYSGAGTVRESVLVSSGLPESRVMGVSLVGAMSQDMIIRVDPTPYHSRTFYRLDKTRSLLYMFQSIRSGILHFFKYQAGSQEVPSLHRDFLSLVEDKTSTRRAGDIYTIMRNNQQPDDFAMAVNIGCAALWAITGAWPRFTLQKSPLSREAEIAAGSFRYGPSDVADYEDDETPAG